MSVGSGSLDAQLRGLGARISGDVVLPADEGFETARLSWNLAVDTRPVAVVFPESADDMVATVQFAAEHGVQLAFIGGGHNAGPLDWSADTLLVKTTRMQGIEIDPQQRRARVQAGTLAKALAHAAGEHGLAYLAGTSPDVGVAGYLLGGGYNWMVRKHGFACNSILAVELVTADGRLVRVDRDSDPDLFWALRGGGGNFGGGDRDRGGAAPDPGGLRRQPVLADRARRRGPERLASLGRHAPGGVPLVRPAAPAPGPPVPAAAPQRPLVRDGGGGVHRRGGRRRGAARAAARARRPSSTPSR